MGVLFTRADLPNTASSSRNDSSSGALSAISRVGETVPTTLLLFSMERTSSSRSGLSSSSSPSSAPGSAYGEPRFLFPKCGVAVLFVGGLFRFEVLLRWTDALLCRCAEPFAPRGVLWTGVRRDDRWGGREACLAGRAPRAPKLKPKVACTEDGLKQLACRVVDRFESVIPSTAHALLSMFAAI
jgi:hypothetical protein